MEGPEHVLGRISVELIQFRRVMVISRLRRTKLTSNTHGLQSRRQSSRSHAKQLRSPTRAGDFAASLLQSPHNALTFLTFPIIAGSHFGAGGDSFLTLRLNWDTRFGRAEVKAQFPVVCENDRSLDGVLKLANVSRPGVGAQLIGICS